MSMQAWGYSELLLDLTKAREVAPEELKIVEDMIEEAEDNYEGINVLHGDISEEFSKAIKDFTLKIENELKVCIELQYVSSEAEGTDYAGSLIWIVEPEYTKEVNDAFFERMSWSEFG